MDTIRCVFCEVSVVRLSETKTLLETGNARRLAQSALDLLMVLCRSEVGAVFSFAGAGELNLMTSNGIDQRILTWAAEDWQHADVTSAAGNTFDHEGRGFLLLPCVREAAPTGFVYVDVTGVPPSKERLQLLQDLLAEATAPAAQPFSLPRSPEAAERQRLLYLLHQNEWNISRVARILKVSRVTLYNKLERHDIDRRRVPKTKTSFA